MENKEFEEVPRPKRERRALQRFSVLEDEIPSKKGKKKASRQPVLEEKEDNFKCAACSSPFITNPSTKRKDADVSRQFSRRKRLNSETGEVEYLCNACGIKWSRHQRGVKPRALPKPKVPLSEDTKNSLISEGEDFAKRMLDILNVTDSKKASNCSKLLFCARILRGKETTSSRLCGCIQSYILGPAAQPRPIGEIGLPVRLNADELSERAEKLLKIASEAGDLKQEGGSARKRSPAYEEHVKTWRGKFRDDLNLCEVACQKLLQYSNNFLHKPLKNVESRGKRVQKMKDPSDLNPEDKLVPVSELPERECCGWRCTQLAKIHPNLIQKWRSDASSGSNDKKREVVKLMSVPVAGGVKNCCNFIRMVTGVCYATIAKVQKEIFEGTEAKPTKKKNKRKIPRKGVKARKMVEGVLETPIVTDRGRNDGAEENSSVDLAERLPSFSGVIKGNISAVQLVGRGEAQQLVTSRITVSLAVDEHAAISTSECVPLTALQPSVLEECPGVGIETTSSNRSLDFQQYFHNIQTQDVPTLTSFVLLNERTMDSN